MPKFSLTVITCTLNSASTINSTLASIDEGTGVSWQHIIIDGNSDDGTRDILSVYQEQRGNVQIFEEKPNGVYAALNYGIKVADSKWTLFLHSDDRLLLNLQTISSILDISQADVISFGVKIKARYTFRKYRANNFSNILCPPPHTGMIFRTSVLKKCFFDEKYSISGDFKQLIKLKYTHNVSFEDKHYELTEMAAGGISTRPSNLILSLKEDAKILSDAGVKYPFMMALLKKILKLKQIKF